MNDDERLAALLTEAADDVEPEERLEEILAAVGDLGRASSQRWWAVGGAVLVAASVVVALVLATGGAPRSSAPDPAAPTTPLPTTASDPDATGDGTAVTVFYIGDTPDGPRLYRELRRVDGGALDGAVRAAVGRDERGRKQYPVDTDYRTVWPPLTLASARLGAEGDLIEVSLGGDPERDLRTRGDLPAAEARLAVEALVRTAQHAAGRPLPVRLLLSDRVTDRVLGVPASEPLDASPDPGVLAEVSLTAPAENLLVDNDDPFTVRGLGRTVAGDVQVSLVSVIGDEPEIEDTATFVGTADAFSSFEVTLDLHGVAPGDYDVVVRSADPPGPRRGHTDSRTITVVE